MAISTYPLARCCSKRSSLPARCWRHGFLFATLTEEESSRVVENLLPSAGLDPAAKARIIEAAEGNPLFVEQILSMPQLPA